MAIYAVWNNKGGVGKSYLTFQLASEYARQNPTKKVLVVDLCPQANSSLYVTWWNDKWRKHTKPDSFSNTEKDNIWIY
ncbi:ParA family protein [Klebsiella pneumoniae subsp. pneumoniae]|nr:ParA family protein [Klebsiella pneumoniae subsp. pneumoniae]